MELLSSSKRGKLFKNLVPNGQIGQTLEKDLTLKQLKELVIDMFAEKERFDSQCKENKQAIETMEQFMYAFLNKRYGLKGLIVSWAAAIVNGLKRFASEDHDLLLFAKILKNECDEEFRKVQDHVRSSIAGILKVWAREKFVHKPDHEIKKTVDRLKQGKIERSTWQLVVEKLYTEVDDRIVVESRLEAFMEEKIKIKKDPGVQLRYQEFEDIVLEYNLNEHEKYLKQFSSVFREADQDSNGILSSNELASLIIRMGIVQIDEQREELTLEQEIEIEMLHKQVKALVQQADPFNSGEITYSEVIKLLSSNCVETEQGEPISLLEFYLAKS